MVFSPAGYLRGLGWGGPGEGLNDSPNARAKPITVHQKKTLAGVGKDRDTAFPWWEMVFASVATKVSGEKTADHHRTSTGIISPLPPPKRSAYEPLPASTSSSGGGINQSALAHAKVEAARRQLYSGFLRGSILGSSLEEEEKEMERVGLAKGKGKDVAGKGKGKAVEKEKDSKKKRKRSEKVDSDEEEEEEEEVKLSKEERRAAKKLRKAAAAVDPTLPSTTTSVDPSSAESDTAPPPKKSKKSKSTSDSVDSTPSSKPKRPKTSTPREHLSPEESIAADELAYIEAREIAKRAAKDERRLAKVVKKALKEKK